mmetsp:Transcript_4969/g.7436  ORF Transcript_4969/g.7436 Transcript_4969/m.7436 type:complete len:100 (-) Transcript_4969:332-631(-)|eukprot:CAMPEP_0170506666 /NCGR_PEP_ID=MMETSP0208-20121228/55811_1 /TAXON_ID=197538 /ORGANISM="Strombidium inclinatum, Strain S3" /LENGTH=99 /DNA_ID=CAMNT_0010788349 /DNA_START=353 /DNA_END=652 /DNA_ORIENTATION=-
MADPHSMYDDDQVCLGMEGETFDCSKKVELKKMLTKNTLASNRRGTRSVMKGSRASPNLAHEYALTSEREGTDTFTKLGHTQRPVHKPLRVGDSASKGS